MWLEREFQRPFQTFGTGYRNHEGIINQTDLGSPLFAPFIINVITAHPPALIAYGCAHADGLTVEVLTGYRPIKKQNAIDDVIGGTDNELYCEDYCAAAGDPGCVKAGGKQHRPTRLGQASLRRFHHLVVLAHDCRIICLASLGQIEITVAATCRSWRDAGLEPVGGLDIFFVGECPLNRRWQG